MEKTFFRSQRESAVVSSTVNADFQVSHQVIAQTLSLKILRLNGRL